MKQVYNTPALKTAKNKYLGNYISGYTDGEGCFSISISKRTKLNVGWEIKPSFAVGQNFDRAEVLHLMQNYFNCGHIRKDKKTLKYEVRKLEDLINLIIPHFKKYPMLSSKQKYFEKFEKICLQIKNLQHLKKETLITIIVNAYSMNGGDSRSGKRKRNLNQILRSLR